MQTVHSAPGTAVGLDSIASSLPARAALALSASLFVALCAHASVPLFFTPVPLTLADFAVLLVGLMLSPAVSFAALVLYLAEGASGLPVFSPAGPGGIAQLFGATGGFLLAYPFAAALAGSLRRIVPGRYASALVAALAASTLLMTLGAIWLGVSHHLSASATFTLATLPFLPGQVVKVVAAAGIASSLNRLRRA